MAKKAVLELRPHVGNAKLHFPKLQVWEKVEFQKVLFRFCSL